MSSFLQSSVSRRLHLVPFFLLLVLGLVVSAPLWKLGFPLQSDDAKCHIVWLEGFAAQRWKGDFYPRWLPNSNAGLGSPAFFYYPPLASWMSCLFDGFARTNSPLGTATLHAATLALGRSAAFALVASSLTLYAWLQTLAPRRFAAVVAALSLISPYRAATDIYVRGAFAEHWAFVWLPLILMATQNLARGENSRRAWCALTFSYALLWLTHPPTALIFAPLALAYSVFSATSSTRSRAAVAISTGSALVFSLTIAAIYLLPALRMEKYVWMEEMRAGRFFYANGFIPLKSARSGFRMLKISLGTLLLLSISGAAILAFLSAAGDEKTENMRRAKFWLVVAIFAGLMTTSLSTPLYVVLPVLQRIQFPFRWLAILSVAASPLMCGAMEILARRAPRDIEYSMSHRWSTRAICGAFCGCVLWWLSLNVFYGRKAYPQFAPRPAILKYLDWYQENRAEMPGHRPRDAQNLTADTVALYRKFGVAAPGYAFAETLGGAEKVRVVEKTARRIELEITAAPLSKKCIIRVRQFAFGTWRAFADAKSLTIKPSVLEGLILLEAPAQTRRITLELTADASEIWGTRITLAALLCWVILLASSLLNSRRKTLKP